jgi:hypothetical protein
VTSTTGTLLRGAIAAATIVVLSTMPAAAQGRGKGLGKQGVRPAGGSSTRGSGTAAGAPGLVGFRQFGSWLDDASLLASGSAWTAISFGHYRTPGGHQNSFPVVDAGIGLTRRAQFGVTVPYYAAHFADGTSFGGLGDVVANLKFSLINPGSGGRAIGLAVTPIVEVVNDPAPGTGRFSFAAPVSVELRAPKYRLFGSSGYFSHGSVFGSGAVEAPVTDRLLVVAALTYSRSVKDNPAADALGLAKSRSDISAVAAYFLTPSIAAFGGTGRTMSGADGSGTSLMLTGGVSFTFAALAVP